MKPTTTNLKNIIENETFLSQLENLKNSNPNYSNQETSMQEVYDGMAEMRNLLSDSIDNGAFEELPFHQRNGISSQLAAVQRYSGNIHQIIQQYNGLENIVHTSGLLERNADKVNFEQKVKEINSLRTRYKKLLKDIQQSEDIKNNIDEIRLTVEEDAEKISSISEKADELKDKYEADEEDIKSKTDSISEAEQEVENRKKEILAFASNIEANDERLHKIYSSLTTEIEIELKDRLKKANDLIKEAENALELKQTEGIAAAYSSRLKKISESSSKIYWLIGAVVFVLITFLFGYLLTGGKISFFYSEIGFNETNNIGFIIGRIALTAIGISAAVFCANRYVLLRNLEEDYEYKVVLTKSILAFANKLRDIDNTKVAEYLTQVLNELHRDPLRNRKDNGGEKSLI